MDTPAIAPGDHLDATPGHAPRFAFTDELTIYGAAQAHRRLQDALASGQPLTLDLGEVSELDSAGVQLLLALARECDALEQPLLITALSDTARAVLDTLGVTRFSAQPATA
ncbi:MAG: lipid asymmetry maintenance protein MlaB [Gammaproteobacteria bacterium]